MSGFKCCAFFAVKLLGFCCTAALLIKMAGAGPDTNITTIERIPTENQTGNATQSEAIITSMEQCILHHASFAYREGLSYCSPEFDNYLCWPPTEAGAKVHQHCPPVYQSDTSKLAYRECGLNGEWYKRPHSNIGWTNFTPCFADEVQGLLGKLYAEKSDPQKMFIIAQNTRYLEIVGFSVSLIALLISLFIFSYYRALRNTRTRIHWNLFLAMTLQVIIRLVLYMDQALIRETSDPKSVKGLDGLPYICEACYIALEYGISAMFCWMFIEGLYLTSIVSANALQECFTFRQYLLIGWGTPVIITGIWAIVTGIHYKNSSSIQQCWYGYNFLNEYWISQGPRLAIIVINLVFLLNIVRVLVMKLIRNDDSEINKARKAARAALVLLPLLGTTNILNMAEAPFSGSVWSFALWSYVTHFLRSFQGLIIALFYCFLNEEVKQLLLKTYDKWRTLRNDNAKIARIQRNWSTSDRPIDRVLPALNNDEIVEVDEICLHDMYSDPQVLDQLETVRCEDATNITHDMYSDPQVLDQLETVRCEDATNITHDMYSDPQVLDQLETVRCDDATNITAPHVVPGWWQSFVSAVNNRITPPRANYDTRGWLLWRTARRYFINLVFLLNIVRVLVSKLTRSDDSEINKARKAVRAALVLLPLLGTTNILNMIEAPLSGSVWRFALWSYVTYFLRSFQGLIIALFYCFLNEEVRQLLLKSYDNWKTLRNDTQRMQRSSRGAARMNRNQSTSFTFFGRVLSALNKFNNDEIDEMDEIDLRDMYSDPQVLDQRETVRCDDETNITNDMYSDPQVLDQLKTVRCDDVTNITD